MRWGVSIWKDISHVSLSQPPGPCHRKARVLSAYEEERVAAQLMFWCGGPSGKGLLDSCRIMTPISELGHMVHLHDLVF